jgi:hypothetical protein
MKDKFKVKELVDKLFEYLKDNKDICWELGDCNDCCRIKCYNCGSHIRNILVELQGELLK